MTQHFLLGTAAKAVYNMGQVGLEMAKWGNIQGSNMLIAVN